MSKRKQQKLRTSGVTPPQTMGEAKLGWAKSGRQIYPIRLTWEVVATGKRGMGEAAKERVPGVP